MKCTPRLSRRQLNASGLSMLLPGTATRSGAIAASTTHRQGAAPWRPEQGLRLAGSTQTALSLDPALSRDLPTNFLLRQVYRGLLRFDDRLDVIPELAETVTISEDRLRYDFVLRDSIRFHNGQPIDSFDVHESLSRALRPATAGGAVDRLAGVTYLRDILGADEVIAGQVAMVAGVEVHDELKLSISIRQPSATFPMKLASVPASIIDRGQVQNDRDWATTPNGSGPFRCDAFTLGQELLLSSSSTWWAGAPLVANVRIRFGPSASQPLNLFEAGEIDIADGIPPHQRDLLRDPASALDGSVLLESPLFAVSYIAFGNSEPPFDDVHIRRALRLAFPVDKIALGSYDGAVTVAKGVIPNGMLGRNWCIEGIEPDLEAAKAEIRLSRYGTPSSVPPISIFAADIEPVEALRDTISSDLGLAIEAVAVNWPDFLNGLASRQFPAYALYWGADYPDPESLLWMLFGSDSPENYTGYRNPEFDSLLARAREEPDELTRIQLYETAHELLIEDAAVLPIFFDIAYTAVRRGIAGLTVTPMGILGLETLRAAD